MRRGTTPTISVDLDFDTDEAQEVWFTIKQGKTEITKEKGDIIKTDNGFEVTLTQSETLELDENGPACMAQVRILTPEGKAIASNVVYIDVEQILKDGVIS